MSAPEPDRAMRTRFMEMLSAYQAGLEQAPVRKPGRATRELGGAQPLVCVVAVESGMAVGYRCCAADCGNRCRAFPRRAA